MAERPDRNPIIIPEREPRAKRCCPKCSSADIVGSNVAGSIVWKCQASGCSNEWKTGIGQVPLLPSEVLPPESYVPPLQFVKNLRGEMEELRRRVDRTPDFRRGALIPEEGEE